MCTQAKERGSERMVAGVVAIDFDYRTISLGKRDGPCPGVFFRESLDRVEG